MVANLLKMGLRGMLVCYCVNLEMYLAAEINIGSQFVLYPLAFYIPEPLARGYKTQQVS